MAVTTTPKLDAHRLRADFPIFEQAFHGKPLAFLDSAASSQKPRQMLEAMTRYATSGRAYCREVEFGNYCLLLSPSGESGAEAHHLNICLS